MFGHGDDAESPIPVPRARSINERAAATNAPAITVAHDTPYALESFVITRLVHIDNSRQSSLLGVAPNLYPTILTSGDECHTRKAGDRLRRYIIDALMERGRNLVQARNFSQRSRREVIALCEFKATSEARTKLSNLPA